MENNVQLANIKLLRSISDSFQQPSTTEVLLTWLGIDINATFWDQISFEQHIIWNILEDWRVILQFI